MLDWMRNPIRIPFSKGFRRVVISRTPNAAATPITRLAPAYRTGDTARGQEEQRRRVRELLAAIGLKAAPSENQISKAIELLGPFVPGLTIESPSCETKVPAAFSVPYVAPSVGRPELDDENCRKLAVEVEQRLRASNGRLSRQAVYAHLVKEAAARGAEPSTVSKAKRWDARGRELLSTK